MVQLNCHLDIVAYFDIIEDLKIVVYIPESIQRKKGDGSWREWEKRYKKVLGSFCFLVIRPGRIA